MIELKTIEADGGITIHIEQDTEADSPRNWGNLGKMVCWHRRYDLGDKHEFKTPDDFTEWSKLNVISAMLPLHLLDHSGIWMRTTSFRDVDPGQWDSGQVGWIYMTEEEFEGGCGGDLQKALDQLRAEVDTYNKYLQGEVYRYWLDRNGELGHSCGGYYSYDECLEEAKEEATNAAAVGPDDEELVEVLEDVIKRADSLRHSIERSGNQRPNLVRRLQASLAIQKRLVEELLAHHDGEKAPHECDKSPTGLHQPSCNALDFRVADGGVNEGDEGVILDVLCKHCHAGGSVRAFFEDIQWDLNPDGGGDE